MVKDVPQNESTNPGRASSVVTVGIGRKNVLVLIIRVKSQLVAWKAGTIMIGVHPLITNGIEHHPDAVHHHPDGVHHHLATPDLNMLHPHLATTAITTVMDRRILEDLVLHLVLLLTAT